MGKCLIHGRTVSRRERASSCSTYPLGLSNKSFEGEGTIVPVDEAEEDESLL